MTERIGTAAVDAGPRSDVVLAVEGLTKNYAATRALDDVSLAVSYGAIHGLMGGNGSGKSTLIKSLAGVVTPEHGRLAFGDHWIDARSHTPRRAKASGLHFVHQQNSTFPDLTVAENLALGRGFETTALKSIAWRAQRVRARQVLDRFEVDVAPSASMGRLSAAMQMMVAIARALQDQDESTHRDVLILDEPTASLPKHEVDVLLAALRRYANQGQTIIYVSHRLGEVISIATEVTVLRNGRVAARLMGADITHESLVDGITGTGSNGSAVATLGTFVPGERTVDAGATSSTADQPLLSVRDPERLSAGPSEILAVQPGEIVAVAGLLGSGRSRLLKRIFGTGPRDGLEVVVDGVPLMSPGVREAMRRGIAFVPENRMREAALPELSIAANLSVACLSAHSRAGWIKPSRERKAADRVITEFGVRAAGPAAPLTSLSGGNQQKVMLARWLQRRPRILLLDEPTQGVDIGARSEIHDLIRAAADAGTAVLVVSSEFGELAALAHRAVIVSKGIVGDGVDGPLTEELLNEIVYAREKAL